MAQNTHEIATAPEIAGVIDLDGSEYGDQASTAPSLASRGYRTIDPTGDAFAGTESHSSRGAADPRRGHATILPDPGDEVQGVDYSNAQALVVVSPESPPDRPRQGFTGADPARAATYRRPLVLRLFDKLMADHPGDQVKVELGGPLAARPRDGLSDLASSQPFAGGSTGTQREGIGTRPNTIRILPNQWDALLIDTGGPAVSSADPDPAATAVSGQVARGRFR